MPWTERFHLAWRQVGDSGRGLSTFLSRLSMIGLILAVAVLLTVLSVMNGFEREMRERILGLVPHVTVRGYADEATWTSQLSQLSSLPEVTRASRFIERDVLALRGQRVNPSRLLGVQPEVLAVWQPMLEPALTALELNEVVIGQSLAKRLQVGVGDRLRLIVPAPDQTAGSPGSRTVACTVVALARTGTELDEGLMLASLSTLQAVGGSEQIGAGLALQLTDLFAAPELRWRLSRTLPPSQYVSDWTSAQGNLYAAIQLSKDMITLLLLSIVAVAAFNVVSSLVLVVTDRKSAIAILQVMGAGRRDILWIFLFQGALIGVIGASIGVFAGIALAQSVPSLASAIEWLLGIQLLNTDVYPLSFLPVDTRAADALLLWSVSVLLCLLAAVVPARRAMRLPVAGILASFAN